MGAAVDVDGVAQRVASLCVGDFADTIVELQAVAADVVEDAAVERDGRLRLVGLRLFRVFADDAEERAVEVALGEFVAEASAMDDDAFPAAWRVVVEEVVEHVVHPVASKHDGLLDASLHNQFPIDVECCFVVEHERGAFCERKRSTGHYGKRVVDDIRLVGQQGGVFGDDDALLLYVGIDGAAGEDDGLLSSILQEEVQLVLEVSRFVAACFGRRHLDANHEAVVAKNLEVMQLSARKEASIHVDTEVTRLSAFELNGAYAHSVAVVVEGVECLCAAGNGADERVEGDSVLRESKSEVGIVREALVVGASHDQQSKQQSKERPPNPL